MPFLTDKAAKERIAALESQVTDLEANSATQDEEIIKLQGEVKSANEATLTANSERDQAKVDLATANTELAAAREKLTAAEAAVTDFEGKVEAAALAKFQALGGEPAPVSAKADESPISSLSGIEKTTAAFKAQSSKK